MDATTNATTLAFTDASVAGEAGAVGDTLAKAHAEQDKPPPPREEHDSGSKWPYTDATGLPSSASASRRGNNNDSSCDDDEILPASCGYYARPVRGCGHPRTCRDCLELDDCMVNQFGACVNITKYGYEPALDYHKAFEFNLTGSGASGANTTLRYHFPGRNATYCPVNDATCLECKRTVFAGDVSDSRFCVGANDCICVASCEATGWEQLAGGLKCGPPPRPKAFAVGGGGPPKTRPDEENAQTSGGVNWRDVWTMGGIPALVVVVGILVASRREQKNKKENLALDSARGEKDVSPKHHFVDLLDARQSVNPQVTILAAPVMGAVIVEASAPPMSPQHDDDGMEPPSAPSFDSEFEYDQEDHDAINRV